MRSDYGGIVLEAHEIKYDEIDLPLRRLVRLINSALWVKSYGCCGGPAFHGHNPDVGHQFFIGLFIDSDNDGIHRLHSWVTQANRLNGSTGLCAEVENVLKHPLGQGSVDGWLAYRLAARNVRRRQVSPGPAVFLRLITCLESAWKELWPLSVATR